MFVILFLMTINSCWLEDIVQMIKERLNREANEMELVVNEDDEKSEAPNIDFRLALNLARALHIIEGSFCGKKKISKQELFDAAMKGMMGSLDDPNSRYLDRDSLKNTKSKIVDNSIGVGIGIYFIKFGINSPILVVQVIEGSPAERAGLKRGDKVTQVEGVDVSTVNSDEIVNMIKGRSGSKVNLLVSREDKILKIAVKRDVIEIDNVTYKMLDDEVGYIKFRSFSIGSSLKIDEAMKSLKKSGAKSIILDIRDNLGGEINEAVKVTSLFVNDSPIFGETSGTNDNLYNSLGEADTETPLALLINGGSASASEILAAALKEYGRALLLGERTYGKGTVQAVIPVDVNDFDSGAMSLTIKKFFSPSRVFIDKVGVEPHIYLGRDSSAMKLMLDEEKNRALNIEDYYMNVLKEMDVQLEKQNRDALNIVKALGYNFKYFLEENRE